MHKLGFINHRPRSITSTNSCISFQARRQALAKLLKNSLFCRSFDKASVPQIINLPLTVQSTTTSKLAQIPCACSWVSQDYSTKMQCYMVHFVSLGWRRWPEGRMEPGRGLFGGWAGRGGSARQILNPGPTGITLAVQICVCKTAGTNPSNPIGWVGMGQRDKNLLT